MEADSRLRSKWPHINQRGRQAFMIAVRMKSRLMRLSASGFEPTWYSIVALAASQSGIALRRAR